MKYLQAMFVTCVLLVALAMPVLASSTVSPSEVPVESSAVESVSPDPEASPDITLPEEGTGEGATELEYLQSINTYVTYLFMFGCFFLVLTIGKLIYSFFNMFF